MLNDLANLMARQVKDALSQLGDKEDLSQEKLKGIAQMALRKCDLVTREEFDAQSAVLEKTRAKLQVMEDQLEALQQSISARD